MSLCLLIAEVSSPPSGRMRQQEHAFIAYATYLDSIHIFGITMEIPINENSIVQFYLNFAHHVSTKRPNSI
jgi:hypothetical protein